MSASRLEFRVRWQREGRPPSYRVYQTWDAACRKVRGIKALEVIKDATRFENMPPLAGPPELQVREVGAWRRHDYQPKASEYDVKSMGQWADYTDPTPRPLTSEDAGVPF